MRTEGAHVALALGIEPHMQEVLTELFCRYCHYYVVVTDKINSLADLPYQAACVCVCVCVCVWVCVCVCIGRYVGGGEFTSCHCKLIKK